MIQIADGIYVGNKNEVPVAYELGYDLCLCAKTFHKQVCGYIGNMDKSDPQYLIADAVQGKNGNWVQAYNLIDAPSKEYIPMEILTATFGFLVRAKSRNRNVLIACDQGRSRSACVGLIYLAFTDFGWDFMTFEEMEEKYKKIYPPYDPGSGMRERTREVINIFLRKRKD